MPDGRTTVRASIGLRELRPLGTSPWAWPLGASVSQQRFDALEGGLELVQAAVRAG